jgi:hypothetical protein
MVLPSCKERTTEAREVSLKLFKTVQGEYLATSNFVARSCTFSLLAQVIHPPCYLKKRKSRAQFRFAPQQLECQQSTRRYWI